MPWSSSLFQDAVRLPLSALAFVVAFAAGGQRRKGDFPFLLTLRATRLKLGLGGVLRLGGNSVVSEAVVWLSRGKLGVSETMAQWGREAANPLTWLNQIHLSSAPVRQVNLHEAKTHLSRLVAGQGFVICKAGKPLVQVTRLTGAEDAATPPRRRLGLLAGQCSVPDDFDQIAAEEIADLFEGLSASAPSSGEL